MPKGPTSPQADRWIGKHPNALFDDPDLKVYLSAALGPQYQTLHESLSVAREIEVDGDWVLASGAASRQGGSEETILALHEDPRFLEFCLLIEAKISCVGNIPIGVTLPSKFKAWLSYHQYVHVDAPPESPTLDASNKTKGDDNAAHSGSVDGMNYSSSHPSFDCARAATFIEKEICAVPLLGALDTALASNYAEMLASNIGDGARSVLIASQKAWLTSRNQCGDRACVLEAYKKRVDDVCDHQVLTGVHPVCKDSSQVQ